MRLAAARAGLWFFGSIIFIAVFLGSIFEDMSTAESIATLVFFGAVIAGAVFCYSWYEHEQEERKQQQAERRKRFAEEPVRTDKTR